MNRRPSYLRSAADSNAFYEDLWRTIKTGRTFLDYLRDHRRGNRQRTGELSLVRSAADRKIAPRDPLGESRRFLSSIVECSEDAIIGQSLDGIIVSWNAGAKAIYGYGGDEVMGKSISILAPADRPDETARILRRVARGEKVAHLETVRVRKDGSAVDVSLTVSPVRNEMGGVVGVATIARDISERKQREEKTRESEERYRLLVTHTPDVMWTADAEGHCVFVTPNIESIYGYTPDEIYRSGVWYDRIHPDDMKMMQESYLNLLATGAMFSMEYRIQRKDGPWIWVEAKAMSSYVKNGKTFTVGIASDITKRKQSEDELRLAKDAAEAANRARSSFLSTMSHELRTPMSGVIGMTDLVLDSDLTDEQRECLSLAKHSANCLLTVIDDLLDYAQVDGGHANAEAVEINVAEFLDGVIGRFRAPAREKGLDLFLEPAAALPLVAKTDPHYLNQILRSLIGNAIKFTERGRVTLAVSHESRNGQDHLHFAVRDTGIGIPVEQQQSVFEPFTQADNTLARTFGGTGLGLALAQRLTQLLRGRIWIESEQGKGSQFHLMVPAECSVWPGSGYLPGETIQQLTH